MSTDPDTNPDSTDSEDIANANDEGLFRLDIVDGEDPSRQVRDNRFRVDPPGPGPSPNTRLAALQDDSFAIIERAALGAWIAADELVNLEDVH